MQMNKVHKKTSQNEDLISVYQAYLLFSKSLSQKLIAENIKKLDFFMNEQDFAFCEGSEFETKERNGYIYVYSAGLIQTCCRHYGITEEETLDAGRGSIRKMKVEKAGRYYFMK